MASGQEESETHGPVKTKVIIGNLKRDVEKGALEELLRKLGHVTNFTIQQPPGNDPASPATGIVEYASAEDAARVVSHVHGKLILGQPVKAWVPAPGASAPPLPQGAPAPHSSSSSAVGPARPTFPGEVDARNVNSNLDTNEARRAPAEEHGSNHEDAQWERPAAPQQTQRLTERGPPPLPGTYGDDYAHGQRAQQPQQSWRTTPNTSQQHGGVDATGAPRFRGDGDQAHYAGRWESQGHEDDEASRWEHSERYPPTHRGPMHRDHPAGYRHPQGPHSSGWYDQTGSRGAYSEGGQYRAPAGRPMMPRHMGRSSAGVPPGGGGSGYGDEDVPVGNRHRPRPPNSAAHGTRHTGDPSSWTDGEEYEVPPPISIKGKDFEKEVVKAAALLVAEREMRAREEARNKDDNGEYEATPGNEGHKDRKRNDRSAGEDVDKRKKWESTNRGGEYQDEKGDGEGPSQKRTRRDRSDSRNVDDRRSSNSRRGEGLMKGSNSRPKAREDSRGRPEEVDDRSRGKHRGRSPEDKRRSGSGARDKEGGSSKSRSSKPGSGSSGWGREDGTGPPRESKEWEPSGADPAYCVHVGGLSFSTTFTTLAKRFAAFGDVNGFKVIFNKVSCRAAESSNRKGSKEEKAAVVTASSGYALISFDNERGMEKAVECMDGQKLDGHILKVTRVGWRSDPDSKSRHSQSSLTTSSSQRAPRRQWVEPAKGRQQEHEQDLREQRKPQSRTEAGGGGGGGALRRQGLVSSASSGVSSAATKQGTHSRNSQRDPSPDPLGALRTPRPSTTSYHHKDSTVSSSSRPDYNNGRLKNGHGGRPMARDTGNGDTRTVWKPHNHKEPSDYNRKFSNNNVSGARRPDKFPGSRPSNNTARPGLKPGFRRQHS